MFHTRKFVFVATLLISAVAIAQDTQSTRAAGVVKSVQGNVISVKSDDGADLTVNVPDGARISRTADLKTTTEAQIVLYGTGGSHDSRRSYRDR